MTESPEPILFRAVVEAVFPLSARNSVILVCVDWEGLLTVGDTIVIQRSNKNLGQYRVMGLNLRDWLPGEINRVSLLLSNDDYRLSDCVGASVDAVKI